MTDVPKITRSETKWKSPAVPDKPGTYDRRVGNTPGVAGFPEGAFYVLQHTSEMVDKIRLCVGGSSADLTRDLLQSLIADLQDAQDSLPNPRRDTVSTPEGFR